MRSKVSFYNQDEGNGKPIKSSTMTAVVGLIEKANWITNLTLSERRTSTRWRKVWTIGRSKRELRPCRSS